MINYFKSYRCCCGSINKLLGLLLLVVFFLSCNQKENKTIIIGNITNLPNGILYLYQEKSNNIIDSIETNNGSFILKHSWKKGIEEPIYLGIDHIDNKGTKRFFNFPTAASFKGSGYYSQYFFSDTIITIKGSISDFIIKDFKQPEKYKLVISPPIIAGNQTKALYNVDGDLFIDINKSTYSKVLKKVKEYPFSFDLLYKITKNKNSFTAKQIQTFLNSFKGEITRSETYEKLYDYNQKMFSKKYLSLPFLEDNNKLKKEIIDTKYKKHLIVFWASWCGPCREEIPLLKLMYKKYYKLVEFVSISTDTDMLAWKKALKKEKMPWKQLNTNIKSSDFETLEVCFQLNQSIPYMVIVDNELKILKSHVGTMTEIELEKFMNN